MLGSTPRRNHHCTESLLKASATCLRQQCDKSRRFGGRALKTHSIYFFIH